MDCEKLPLKSHRFGGTWTEAKLDVLRNYLSAYTTALKKAPFFLHYIDAFAGTGVYRAKGDGSHERQGSASIALDTNGFARYTFIEKNRRHVKSLEILAASQRNKRVDVLHGDANALIADLCANENWKHQRAVMFLDPFGMTVGWETLERICRTGAIDVWYLFPLNGLFRQMTHNPAKRDEDKDRSLDRLLGTSSWRTDLYAPEPMADMFTNERASERTKDQRVVLDWLNCRLRSVFPYVHEPAVLRMGAAGNRHGGPALFALYFLMSNDNPKAVGLAKKLVAGVIAGLKKSGTLG